MDPYYFINDEQYKRMTGFTIEQRRAEDRFRAQQYKEYTAVFDAIINRPSPKWRSFNFTRDVPQ